MVDTSRADFMTGIWFILSRNKLVISCLIYYHTSDGWKVFESFFQKCMKIRWNEHKDLGSRMCDLFGEQYLPKLVLHGFNGSGVRFVLILTGDCMVTRHLYWDKLYHWASPWGCWVIVWVSFWPLLYLSGHLMLLDTSATAVEWTFQRNALVYLFILDERAMNGWMGCAEFLLSLFRAARAVDAGGTANDAHACEAWCEPVCLLGLF